MLHPRVKMSCPNISLAIIAILIRHPDSQKVFSRALQRCVKSSILSRTLRNASLSQSKELKTPTRITGTQAPLPLQGLSLSNSVKRLQNLHHQRQHLVSCRAQTARLCGDLHSHA